MILFINLYSGIYLEMIDLFTALVFTVFFFWFIYSNIVNFFYKTFNGYSYISREEYNKLSEDHKKLYKEVNCFVCKNKLQPEAYYYKNSISGCVNYVCDNQH